MLFLQKTVVFLWLLPVAAQIILPLAILVFVSVRKLFSHSPREGVTLAEPRLGTS